MQETEGLNQGIVLKFSPQGRGSSLANTKLLFNLLDDIALSLSEADKTLALMQ